MSTTRVWEAVVIASTVSVDTHKFQNIFSRLSKSGSWDGVLGPTPNRVT